LKMKKALFNESNVPKGGTCLSSFLVLRSDGKILVGKMTRPEIWIEKFLVGEMFAEKYAKSSKWVLPASHLLYGEHPFDAARRVLSDQLAVKDKLELSLTQVQSHLSQDPKDPDVAHWDVCFVYDGEIHQTIARPAWYASLELVDPSAISKDDFTRGHGDVLEQLGLIK
jgi:cation diffusion facilitator CzcD-associated flavoprotein CzcO